MTAPAASFGLSVAMATPFLPDGRIDYGRLVAHARWCLENGCSSITAFGTTGEGASIGPAGREQVLGALAARFPGWGLGAWIAVVTTVIAAVGAHAAAARYDYQLVEYLRTAQELTRLRRATAYATSDAELGDLVVQCERVISIQDEGWMAKLSTAAEA